MSAASAELLEGSSLLRELVKGLRVGEADAAVEVPDGVLGARNVEAKRAMAS
jgi:hypothetical protein